MWQPFSAPLAEGVSGLAAVAIDFVGEVVDPDDDEAVLVVVAADGAAGIVSVQRKNKNVSSNCLSRSMACRRIPSITICRPISVACCLLTWWYRLTIQSMNSEAINTW